MKAIVAVDDNWAIGNKNQLLLKIPHDMTVFIARTTHSVVVMGRKTLESFPNQKPLKHRINLVLTRDAEINNVEGATILHSMDELKDELKKYDTNEVFIIGGGEIYKQLIDECDTAYVTKIHTTFEADTWFPNLDDIKQWEIQEESMMMVHEGIEYQFVTYVNKSLVSQ